MPDPELVEQAKRRTFTAEYKARILAEAEACMRPGEIGELLRREGLYTSHLTYWRKQRKAGALKELGRPRGRKPSDRRDHVSPSCAAVPSVPRRSLRRRRRSWEFREISQRCWSSVRYRRREREHRAMIERTVEELTPIIGTRPACRAVGRLASDDLPSPTSTAAAAGPAAADIGPSAERARAPAGARRVALGAVRGRLAGETHATLLDEGTYLCSTRTMYRILDAHHGGVRERRDQLTHPPYAKPELLAQRPNELWSWDISKLLGPAKWTYYYLYVILDVFSRYIVAWAVQYRETAQLAKALIEQATEQQQITRRS